MLIDVSDKIKIPIEIEQKILSRFIAMSERNISAIDHALGGAFQGGEIPFGRVVNGSKGNDHPAYGRCPEYPGPDFKYA